MRRIQFWGVPIILVCGALAVIAASFVVSPVWLLFLQNVIVFGLFAVATNLIVGYGGLISFGQASFYGFGAYVIALGWLHYHVPFWILFVISPLIGAGTAAIIGALSLRTRLFYFALLTLAFSELFFTIANKWYDFTRGANGVFGSMIPFTLVDPQHGLWFILGVTFVALLVLWAIIVSPFGLTLRAIRENSKRMEALGVSLYRHQLYAFMLSGAFCSLAGALFVVHDQSAYPGLLAWTLSGESILVALIGGMHYFLGPMLGSVIYVFAHDYLIAHTHQWKLILGIALVVIVMFAPDGLLGLRRGGYLSFDGLRRIKALLTALFHGKRAP